MEMQSINTAVDVMMTFFCVVICITGGTSAILRLFSPFKKLKSQVEEHEAKLQQDYHRMESVDRMIDNVEKSDRIICKSLLVLLNHSITGNGIDKLKEQRDKLEQYLIDK